MGGEAGNRRGLFIHLHSPQTLPAAPMGIEEIGVEIAQSRLGFVEPPIVGKGNLNRFAET